MADAAIFNPILIRAQTFALNQFKDNINQIKVGDDNTEPTISDTDVGNQIGVSSIESLDESVLGQLTYNAKYGITDFVGDTIKELVLWDSTESEGYGRALTVERLKGGDQIFWVQAKVKATAKNKVTA